MKKILTALAVAALLAPTFAFAAVNITLSGGSVTVQQGTSYNEPGYSAFSSSDGDITGSVTTTGPNTGVIGSSGVSYSVTDSAFNTATAFRSVSVVGAPAGAMPYCSGPMAPGWNMGLLGGGCGGTGMWVPAGDVYTVSKVGGIGHVGRCPDWFVGGCMIQL